jgi:hypothetical protein
LRFAIDGNVCACATIAVIVLAVPAIQYVCTTRPKEVVSALTAVHAIVVILSSKLIGICLAAQPVLEIAR